MIRTVLDPGSSVARPATCGLLGYDGSGTLRARDGVKGNDEIFSDPGDDALAND